MIGGVVTVRTANKLSRFQKQPSDKSYNSMTTSPQRWFIRNGCFHGADSKALCKAVLMLPAENHITFQAVQRFQVPRGHQCGQISLNIFQNWQFNNETIRSWEFPTSISKPKLNPPGRPATTFFDTET